MPKKIKLDLKDLNVESFKTSSQSNVLGGDLIKSKGGCEGGGGGTVYDSACCGLKTQGGHYYESECQAI